MKNKLKSRCVRLMSAVVMGCGLAACDPDGYLTTFDPEGNESEWSYVDLPVSIDVETGDRTKASLLYNAELKKTGALLLVFRSSTRRLESYKAFSAAELAAAETVPLKITVPVTDCDFYLLGNLHAINRSTGAAANLMEALGGAFPMDEADLEALVYRLDGGELNPVWRRETMAEVQQYGLPFSCIEKNVSVRSLISAHGHVPQMPAKWLFSKVVIRVDHGLFDGGDAAKAGYFVNKELYIRQANLRLFPFSASACKAVEAADSGTGDYDAAMANASVGEYVFYVPENMQGTVSGVTDGAMKNKDNIAGIPADVRNYGTYVEFHGQLDEAAGGFGGSVTYQFYLGANETTDFNLERGRQYNVTLSFTAGRLFGPPNWKVTPVLTDSRKFWITADEANTTDISSVNASRALAVRKSRPGRFYLYMNPTGLGGTNYLKGKEHERSSSFVMDDMADCAWYGDLMKPGTSDYQWLADRGIKAVWDAAAARLQFDVTDPAKFDAATLGEVREFQLKVLPDVGSPIVSKFKIKLVADMTLTVADGKSLTDEFYLGQKRTVSVSGFSGTDVRYAAIQPDCGPKHGNQMWKPSDSASAPFPTVAGSAASPVLNPANATYANQKMTGSLDIYAWYPNKFQSSHGWTSRPGKIVIFSEDYLNDSLEAEIVISEPRYVPWTSVSSKYSGRTKANVACLNLDGTELATSPVYKTYNGSSYMYKSDFDAALYGQLLEVSLSQVTPVSGKPHFASMVDADADGSVYICSTMVDGNKLEEERYSETDAPFFVGNHISGSDQLKYLSMGEFSLAPNPATQLYSSNNYKFEVRALKFEMGKVVNSSGYGAFALKNGKQVSHYFNWIAYETSPDEPLPMKQEFKVGYRHLFGTKENLDLSMSGAGKVTFTASNGTIVEPNVQYYINDEYYGFILDPDAQTKYVGSERVPGELCVPYGAQSFKAVWKNKWDGREFVEEKNFDLVYDSYLNVPLYAFTTTSCKVFMVTPLAAKILTESGAQMTHNGREFCTRMVGVDLSEWTQYSIAFYDSDYHSYSSASQRGKYYFFNYDYSNTYMNRQYRKVKGFEVPMQVYRESGMSSWTEAKAKDMLWTAASYNPNGWSLRYGLIYSDVDQNKAGAANTYQNYQPGNSWDYTGYVRGEDIGYGDRIDKISDSGIETSGAGSVKLPTTASVKNYRAYLWLGNTSW